MTKGKARRVDYYPDEYIAGVGGVLRADEQGVYWMICSLIMSEGGPIEQNDRRFAALCRIRPADVKKIVETLVHAGKLLRQSDGKLFQKRAQSEVEKSLKRIQIASENGSNGGRPSAKSEGNQRNKKADGSFSEKLTTNHQPPTTNHQPLIDEESNDPSSRRDEEFSEFWQVYPRKASKPSAKRSYAAARKKVDHETIIVGARAYAGQRAGQDPKYTKQPATWLNNECWAEALAAAPGADWRDDPIYAGVE